jgi:CelD/BcsL family acetyltransferase involved in cellulose biosynthesis
MTEIFGAVIEATAEFEALAPEWWELWLRRPDALPFLTPAWLLPWWRHFSPGPLLVLAARREGRLVGLAPFYIEHGPAERRLLPVGISLSDHLDVLADPACEGEALACLAETARARRDDWYRWELEDLAPDAVALRLPLPTGSVEEITEQSPCPLLVLPPDPEFPACFPRAKRRHLNLARNRAARRGGIGIERAGDAAEALEALEHLVRLHERRWRSRGGAGVLAPAPVQAFQREATPLLQEAGLLRLYTLSIAGIAVAVHYQMIRGRRSFEYLTGFDPDYDYESPGLLLLAHAIEQAAAEGCRRIDFLRGGEAYKYEWGAVDRFNVKRSIRQGGDG